MRVVIHCLTLALQLISCGNCESIMDKFWGCSGQSRTQMYEQLLRHITSSYELSDFRCTVTCSKSYSALWSGHAHQTRSSAWSHTHSDSPDDRPGVGGLIHSPCQYATLCSDLYSMHFAVIISGWCSRRLWAPFRFFSHKPTMTSSIDCTTTTRRLFFFLQQWGKLF